MSDTQTTNPLPPVPRPADRTIKSRWRQEMGKYQTKVQERRKVHLANQAADAHNKALAVDQGNRASRRAHLQKDGES